MATRLTALAYDRRSRVAMPLAARHGHATAVPVLRGRSGAWPWHPTAPGFGRSLASRGLGITPQAPTPARPILIGPGPTPPERPPHAHVFHPPRRPRHVRPDRRP